jgi:hypothetical protein
VKLAGAALQWPFAARFANAAGIVMVPAGQASEPPQPGDLISLRYTCCACGVEVAPHDRLGVGDQHLRDGALCGPVEEHEVRA